MMTTETPKTIAESNHSAALELAGYDYETLRESLAAHAVNVIDTARENQVDAHEAIVHFMSLIEFTADLVGDQVSDQADILGRSNFWYAVSVEASSEYVIKTVDMARMSRLSASETVQAYLSEMARHENQKISQVAGAVDEENELTWNEFVQADRSTRTLEIYPGTVDGVAATLYVSETDPDYYDDIDRSDTEFDIDLTDAQLDAVIDVLSVIRDGRSRGQG